MLYKYVEMRLVQSQYVLHIIIQICVLYDRMDLLDVDGIVRFILSLQRPDGSFTGDKWGVSF